MEVKLSIPHKPKPKRTEAFFTHHCPMLRLRFSLSHVYGFAALDKRGYGFCICAPILASTASSSKKQFNTYLH